jgi:PAS domain S-box-containing protein
VNFIGDVRRVMESNSPREAEVRSVEGSWFLRRIRPYLNGTDTTAGVAVTFMDISERKRAEMQLHRLLEMRAVGVVFFDPDGGITGANDAFLDMIGFTRQELDAGEIRYEALTPPEWRWRDEETIAQLRATGEGGPCEKEYFRKDGSRIWIYCTSKSLPDGKAIEFVLDITARKNTEAALLRSEERLNKILDTDAIGVLFFNRDGTLVDANNMFSKMTGWTRQDIESGELHWRSMTPQEWVAVSEEQMDRLSRTGRIGPYEKEYIKKDGTRARMLFTGRDLGDGTVVEIVVDISNRMSAL